MNHLRFLRYVDEVARTGSIRHAADRLHVAASAVNRRILDLEDELGTPLFERVPRGMRLTSAGELFIRYVRSRAAALDEMRSQIEDLKGLRRGHVSVVVSQALAPAFMPGVVKKFRSTHPLVSYAVRVGNHHEALVALRSYEADLALVFNLPAASDIEVIAAMEEQLVAVMHRSHPLAGRASVRLHECTDYPLVLPGREIAGRELLEKFVARSSVRLQPLVESNSFEFLRGCLHQGQAITFQVSVGAVTDGGALVALPVEDRRFPRGELMLARLRERQLPVIAHSFSEHLREALERPRQ